MLHQPELYLFERRRTRSVEEIEGLLKDFELPLVSPNKKTPKTSGAFISQVRRNFYGKTELIPPVGSYNIDYTALDKKITIPKIGESTKKKSDKPKKPGKSSKLCPDWRPRSRTRTELQRNKSVIIE